MGGRYFAEIIRVWAYVSIAVLVLLCESASDVMKHDIALRNLFHIEVRFVWMLVFDIII